MKRIMITGAGGPMGVNVTRSIKKAQEDIFTVGTDYNRFEEGKNEWFYFKRGHNWKRGKNW